MEEVGCNIPCEVFLSQHVTGNWRVPGRGDLGRRVHWLGLHRPHVVVADVVVHHGGKGWREGQASRGKEHMITQHNSERCRQTVNEATKTTMTMICFAVLCLCFFFSFNSVTSMDIISDWNGGQNL